MAISYVVKLLLNPVLIVPSSLQVFLLKRIEGINFNPFKMNLDDNDLNTQKENLAALEGSK